MTLQQDLATDLLWFLVALTALTWFGVWVAHAIRRDRLNTMPQEQPEQPHECSIGGCHQAATHQWPTGVTGTDYFACEGHTPTVRQWAGPYDHAVETVYDQDLDTVDLALWETEL